jgi:hypothetical protein
MESFLLAAKESVQNVSKRRVKLVNFIRAIE